MNPTEKRDSLKGTNNKIAITPPKKDLRHILVADDDPDDLFLIRKAFQENEIPNPLICARDGEAVLQYLRREGVFAGLSRVPLPSLILLDLNMPRRNGHETLRALKNDPVFKFIPAIVLSTSTSEEDVSKAYQLGANSYIVKPNSYDKLVAAVKTIRDFWLQATQLPAACENQRIS